MRDAITKIFEKENGILIGAIHLPPLPGYEGFPGLEVATKNALADLDAFEKGGADAVIFENNYDIPHVEYVSREVADAMRSIGTEIVRAAKIPVGVSVLWNDYKTALSLTKELGGFFIRVPVFVDTVETSYGIIKGDAEAVTSYRDKLKAQNIALLTDIHVKHSKLLSSFSIEESARLAIKKGSDGLIITGEWTGKAPEMEKLQQVKNIAPDFPIFVGSGTNETNIKDLLRFANGVIVSTSVKSGEEKSELVNIKSYEQRVDVKKVERLRDNIS